MRDIDRLIALVRNEFPDVLCEQLAILHPADDDGIWFFRLPGVKGEVQAESSSGMCPFIVETDKHDERVHSETIEAAARTIGAWLRLPWPS